MYFGKFRDRARAIKVIVNNLCCFGMRLSIGLWTFNLEMSRLLQGKYLSWSLMILIW